VKNNPSLIKNKKLREYTNQQEVTTENISIVKLPSDPHNFISYEENTYQANVFDSPDNRNDSNIKLFLPRTVETGLFAGRSAFEIFFKNAPEPLIAACQYIVHGDEIEVVFMQTRRGWKRLGIMRALIDAIKQTHAIEKIKFYEPTSVGKKFIKGYED